MVKNNDDSDDAIVITGMSGRFPKANNIQELANNLYTKVDCSTNSRIRYGNKVHPDVPKRLGLLNDINHFDGGYFGLSRREIDCMDAMCRISLECTYEAILDAGLNVKDFNAKKICVCVAASTEESENNFLTPGLNLERSYCVANTVRSAITSRIHYWLKTKGKAIAGDSACSSSQFCVEHAYKSLIEENYDFAIVIGANLCLRQILTVMYSKLGVLSRDSTCRSFDDNGNGYLRSEGVACIIMQKSSTAKRVYAEIVHAKVNCDGYKDKGITFPLGESQQQLLKECYEESGVEPTSVVYVEAHGTGTPAGDPVELNAITEVFCNGRKRPLLIGSVKSNIGHSELAAGVCGIIKILIGYHSGLIPPNINYKNPKRTIPGLMDKALIVVTEPTPWPDSKCLVGVSSFGFGGANGHIILRRHNKHKLNDGIPQDNLPRLVCVSARTEESLTNILNDLKRRKLDAEYVALYNEIYKNSNAQDIYRGFIILSKEDVAIEGVRNCTKQEKITLYFGKEDEVLASTLRAVQEFIPFAIAIKNAKECLKIFNTQLVEEIIEKFDAKNRIHVIIGSSIMQIGIHDTLKLLNADVKNVLGEEIGILITYYTKGIISIQEYLSIAYFYAKEATLELNKFISNWKFNKRLFNELYHKNGRTLPKNVVCCGKLLHKLPENFLQFFGSSTNVSVHEYLHDLGTIYTMGCDLHLAELYPKVNYPVTLQTPMISPLLRWNHDKLYKTVAAQSQEINRYKQIAIDIKHEDWSFLQGHMIDGRISFPATGFLFLIWDLVAEMHFKPINECSVTFQDVRFITSLNLLKDKRVYLNLSILYSGKFEISEDGAALVTGKVYINTNQKTPERKEQFQMWEELELKTKDVYKELRLRNYNYSGLFKGIKECALDGTKAKVEWKTNWVSFLDNLLQVLMLTKDTRNLYVPVGIDLLVVDSESHKKCIEMNTDKDNNILLPVIVMSESNIVKSGGAMISGLSANTIFKRRPLDEPLLQTYKFVPNNTEASIDVSITIIMQIILENAQVIKVKVAELLDSVTNEDVKPISPHILNALEEISLIQPEVTIYSNASLSVEKITVQPLPFDVTENYLLVIGVNLLSKKETLRNLASSIKPNTYIASREYTGTYDVPRNLQILTTHNIGKERIILMQKSSTLTDPIAVPLNEDITSFNWLKELQKALHSERHVIVYTQNRKINGLLGLINCVRKEADGKRIKCMLLDDTAPTFDLNDPFYVKQLQKDLAINVYQKGLWGSYRYLLLSNQNVQNEMPYSYANTRIIGDFSSLTWMEGYPLCYDHKPVIKVHYSALNFKDIMIASGRVMLDMKRIEQNSLLGFEYSGIDQVGRRVMGMTKRGGIATEVTPDTCLMWVVPDEWSLAQAATVPCVYSTSLYALLVIGKLKRGESVLIHSGAGGVGQAAINIALHYDCEIFVTVGTQQKKEFILKNYPRIKESNIGNSRDTSFESLVLTQTNGRGVHLVLNSLTEEKLYASVRCLASGGRFLEISKFDLLNNRKLSLKLMNENKSYNGLMLDNLMHAEVHQRMVIQKLLIDAIKDGIVKPLINTVYGYDKIESAFRYMSTGKHVGKVLVGIRHENEAERLPKCIPMFYCNPNLCSIILGGLGGFGLELADWLVLRGARKLILTSRRGITNGYQRYRIRTWENYGAEIVIRTDNIKTYDGCLSIIEDINKWAPIENIFNLACILKDKTIINQTVEDFEESFAPKAFATQHFDKITRNLCKTLKNFVVFSSIACGRGNGGQSNYGMANSLMERICERRKEDGYPGLAIQWGAIGDVGVLQEHHLASKNEVVISGTLLQPISNCLDTLDILLNRNESIVSSMVIARMKYTNHRNIIQDVANIIGIHDIKTVSPHIKLPEMGMDSMMVVEIKQTLEQEYNVFLTSKEIRNLTFARLTEISAKYEAIKKGTHRKEDRNVGLEFLLHFINDEVDDGKLVVNLKNNVQCEKNDSETVYFLPGYEGTYKSFTSLSKKLTMNALSFQYSIKNEAETVTDIAKNILPEFLKNLKQSRRFILVAHSFGVLVALELTSLIEELGYIGQLIFIDGSPKMTKLIVEQQLNNKEDINQLQINLLMKILTHIYSLDDYIKYKVQLQELESYEDKVNFLNDKLPTNIEYGKNYHRLLSLFLYKRLLAVKYYKPPFNKIRSSVRLYKAKVPIIQNLEEDHGLSRLCHQEIKVKEFDGNHVSILDNDELASEINNLIKDDITDDIHADNIERHRAASCKS